MSRPVLLHGSSLALLILEMFLNVVQIHLFILEVIVDAQILHVLSAQQAQIVDRLRHIHDGLSDLAEAKRDLKVVVTAFVTTSDLALTD